MSDRTRDKSQPKFAPLGSISWGTMREEDLIPKFEGYLQEFGVEVERPPAVTKLLDEDDGFLNDKEREEVSWYLNEDLWEAMDDLAPPYCSFGSHEGDGADYGFWVDWDALRDAIADGEVLQVEAGDEWPNPLPENVSYFLENNDHGNCALLDRDGNMIWDVV
jgi:hypothetical protein